MKFINTTKDQRGVTLIELLVGMGIFAAFAILIVLFAGDIADTSRSVSRTLFSQQEAAQALQRMIPEIRSAAQSNIGNYPIQQATSTSLIFYSDIDQDELYERIRYFLDESDSTFKKGVIEPSGQPLSYPTSSEVIFDLVENINMQSQPIFSFFDKNATSSLSNPMPYPVDVLEVKIIKIELRFNEGSVNRPVIKGVENIATIRNLRFKDNNEQF